MEESMSSEVTAEKKPANKNEVSLDFNVAGEPAQVTANKNAPLRTAALEALRLTENEGKPIDDWQCKIALGPPLALDQKIVEFGFAPGTVITMSLKAGAAG